MPLTNYTYHTYISVAGGASGLSAGAVIYYDLETHDLIAAGKCRPDRKDYRIAYNGTELDRIFINTGRVAFRLQSSIAANATGIYDLYYGFADETAEPPQDPHYVWLHYYDGSTSDIAALTKVGSNISQVVIPNAKLLKYGQGPVLSWQDPPPGFSCKMVREVRYYDDTAISGYYYAHYQGIIRISNGKAEEGIARSTDLINWSKFWSGNEGIVRWTNEQAAGFGGTIISKFPWQIDGQNLYYCTTITAGSVDGNGIGMPPYNLWGGYATSPDGIWTGTTSPIVPANSEYDSNYSVDGEIRAYSNGDGTYTYYIIYGACSDAHGQYVGFTKATHPLGPYTKQPPLFRSGGENPKIWFDDNYAYITVNPIGGYNCYANILYWCPIAHWQDPAYWDTDNCVRFVEGTIDGWDAYAINDMGVPIIKDGMAYLSYAAYGATDYHSSDIHSYFSGGLIEGEFPFPYDNMVKIGASSTATVPVSLLGSGVSGDIVIRIKLFRDSDGFTISGVAESYHIGCTSDVDSVYPDYIYGNLHISVNSSAVSPIVTIPNDVQDSRTWTFRRLTNGQVKIYSGGILFWQSAVGASNAALSVTVNANTILESVSAITDTLITYPDTTPPTVIADPPQATYSSTQYVTLTAYTDATLTTVDEPATILYTLDGSDPKDMLQIGPDDKCLMGSDDVPLIWE